MKIRKGLWPSLMAFAALIIGGAYLYWAGANVFWPGFFAMLLFYGIIFLLGAWIAGQRNDGKSEDMMLAGRSIPLFVAVFTMSATWVGGGYINGTAEYTASFGLMWVQAPWGYAMSLIIGGLFFAGKMRARSYHTMLDPLQERFGKRTTALFFLPALAGELFWTAAILTALGTTFGTVLGLDTTPAILLSAVIAIAYTAVGGLWAVALTDVVQMILLMLGLLIVLPSAMGNLGGMEKVWELYQAQHGDLASFWPTKAALGNYYWNWWDNSLLLIFGGIAWQVYFQRVLSAKNAKTAVWLSIVAGFVCLLAAIPAVLIGMIGGVTDWTAMGLPSPPDSASTLPYVVRYLTNPWVATIGLGAVAAAVMSSVDSSILSASSLASWNVYKPLLRPNISSDELGRVIQKCIWIIGIAATLLALQIKSVYELWYLCSDFVYCLLFPALVCALFDPKANRWGALAGFAVASVLRFGGGDAILGIPILLPYPMIEDGVVLFPFRTLAMLAGLVSIILVSRLTVSKAQHLSSDEMSVKG
ncbi:MAG: sodium:solute symporter family protein [Bacteroidota bacterium]